MSIAAVTQAIDNFGVNDVALRELLLAQKDTELAELEMELSKHKARIEAQKQAIKDEFEQRANDLKLILDGQV
jgi:hypothetical protein